MMLALRLSVHPARGGGEGTEGFGQGKPISCLSVKFVVGILTCSQGMLVVRGNDVTHCHCCASPKCRRIHPVLESPHVC